MERGEEQKGRVRTTNRIVITTVIERIGTHKENRRGREETRDRSE